MIYCGKGWLFGLMEESEIGSWCCRGWIDDKIIGEQNVIVDRKGLGK